MADILTQLQTCLDQLATQFYATIGYLTTYHDNSPATPPDNPTAAPALAKIQKNSTNPPIPASAAAILSTTSQASPPAGGGGTGGAATTPGPGPGTAPGTGTGEGGGVDPSLPPRPDSPRTFAARQRELARDLVIKEQQIEYLISVLPGIASSEAEQERRIRELGVELRGAEEVRDRKVKELRALRRRLEGVLGAVEKGIYVNRADARK